MNKTKLIVAISGFLLLTFSINSCSTKTEPADDKQYYVVIETEYGNITLMLYNETPLHRDNFIANANNELYNGSLFHRVINTFMIQGGDPNTRAIINSTDSIQEILVNAEFVPSLFHKRGALAAARMPDNVNPEKKSSGFQFYIVQGKTFNERELNQIAHKKNDNLEKSTINNIVMAKANNLLDQGLEPDFNQIYNDLQDSIHNVLSLLPSYSYTQDQVNAYTSVGGAPHLDGDYTVFGEVIEGMEVVDKIASVDTDRANKPLTDIRMKVRITQK